MKGKSSLDIPLSLSLYTSSSGDPRPGKMYELHVLAIPLALLPTGGAKRDKHKMVYIDLKERK